MPQRFCRYSPKNVNPPLSMAILYPQRFNTVIKRSAPSVIGRFSAISFITLTSRPFSSATRSVKLCLKSISPRMARAVISFTLSPTPARIASSSMHSVCIRVESISKQIRRRILRNILSSWKEKSISIVCDSSINLPCIASRSLALPRRENSMQARAFLRGFRIERRPVSRRIESMLNPCSAITVVAASICRASRCLPMMVRIYRFFPWRFTHSSYSSSLMGAKPMFTPSSVALNSSSFIT